MTTAFVLSGGGSLGAVQVGMLIALAERDIAPDLLVGTSVGAINAAWVAGTQPRRQDSETPTSLARSAIGLAFSRASSTAELRRMWTRQCGLLPEVLPPQRRCPSRRGMLNRPAAPLVVTAICAWLGARVFRAHQVKETRQVLDMAASIRGDRPPTPAIRGLGHTRHDMPYHDHMPDRHAMVGAKTGECRHELFPQMNRLPHPGSDVDALFEHLHSTGPGYVEAVERLHGLMLRAARHQLARMPAACSRLGAAGIDEIANQAADEATVAALGKVDSFEGRSRFSTWAYKFGVLHALSSANRAAWRDRDLPLDAVSEPPAKTLSPEASLEEAEMSSILSAAISKSLTPHQRDVIIALILNDVPIDALAEQMGLTRNALYKVLYDARKRLRSILQAQGYLTDTTTRGV